MELAQLKGYGFVGLKQFRILKEMQTVKFHAFLRKYTAKLQDFHRDFIAPTTKLWVEGTHADIKESLLKQYLFRKRRAFLDKLTQHDVLTFEVPTVTLEEVHEFIKEQDNDQKDPLRHHLIEVENKVDHYYRTRNLPKWPFRRNKEQEATGEFACPLLLLLHSFHPEDMLLILLSFSEAVKAQQHAHNNPDHGSSNKHSNKKEKYHKLYDHAPGIDPHAGHNLGKSSIDPSTLGHGSSHYNNLGGSRGFSGSGSFNNSSRSTVLDNANQHRHRPSGANFLGSSGINMNSSNAAYSSPKRPTKVRDNLEFSGSLSSSRPSAPMGSMKSPNARASHRTTNLSMSSSISPRKL